MNKQIAAFFDIDGTIYRDSLVTELYKKLLKYEIIPKEEYFKQVKEPRLAWENRQLSYEEYLEALTENFSTTIKGLTKNQIEFVTNQVMKLSSDKVYTYTRDKINEHKKQGHMVIFISGSPDFIVERMGDKYGANLAIGSSYEFKKDLFTGKIKPMWTSRAKNKKINELVEEFNIDLEKSFAYGDTNGDALMLSKVGNPIAINPNKELLANIMKLKDNSNYKIIVERKDSIYNLTPEQLKESKDI